jgi:hypothetical protein
MHKKMRIFVIIRYRSACRAMREAQLKASTPGASLKTNDFLYHSVYRRCLMNTSNVKLLSVCADTLVLNVYPTNGQYQIIDSNKIVRYVHNGDGAASRASRTVGRG